jgi:hypothetical protein
MNTIYFILVSAGELKLMIYSELKDFIIIRLSMNWRTLSFCINYPVECNKIPFASITCQYLSILHLWRKDKFVLLLGFYGGDCAGDFLQKSLIPAMIWRAPPYQKYHFYSRIFSSESGGTMRICDPSLCNYKPRLFVYGLTVIWIYSS